MNKITSKRGADKRRHAPVGGAPGSKSQPPTMIDLMVVFVGRGSISATVERGAFTQMALTGAMLATLGTRGEGCPIRAAHQALMRMYLAGAVIQPDLREHVLNLSAFIATHGPTDLPLDGGEYDRVVLTVERGGDAVVTFLFEADSPRARAAAPSNH